MRINITCPCGAVFEGEATGNDLIGGVQREAENFAKVHSAHDGRDTGRAAVEAYLQDPAFTPPLTD